MIRRDDVIPDVAPRRVRPHDVWQLGAHRLICGDALEPGVVATLMGDEQARMVFTDPPYNAPIDGHAGGLRQDQASRVCDGVG